MILANKKTAYILGVCLLLLFSISGVALFVWHTSIISILTGEYTLSLYWHPLFIAFHDYAPADWSGNLHSTLLWAQLAATIALSVAIKPPLWKCLLVVYTLAVLPCWGLLFPLELRWLLLILAGVAKWKGWYSTGGLLLATSILYEPMYVSVVSYPIYGLIVGANIWLILPIALAGVAAGSWIIARGRRLIPLIPALMLAVLAYSSLASFAAIEKHHDEVPEPGVCEALEIKTLNPLKEWWGKAWSLLDTPGGLYVGGDSMLVKLDEYGKILSKLTIRHGDRVSSMAFMDGIVFGSSSFEMVSWNPDTGQYQRLHRDVFPELKNVSIFNGIPYWATMAPGLVLRGTSQPDIHYCRLSGPLIVLAHENRLYIIDLKSINEMDPMTLQPRRSIDLGISTLIHNISVSGNSLYLSNSIQKTVEEIDLERFTHVRSIPLEYPTRYIAVSRDKGLLATTNFFGETVDIFSLDSGRRITSYRIGLRPRGVIYSPDKEAFLCVSACGVFRIPVPPIERKKMQGP